MLLPGNLINCKGQEQTRVIGKSEYFEFHSNYWINLHHFLYQQAQGSQAQKLMEDGNQLLNIGEDSIRSTLSFSETEKLTSAIEYYKTHLIGRSLSELGNMHIWLEAQSYKGPITDTIFTAVYATTLNDFSPVYKMHYWPKHNAQNSLVLNTHIGIIRQIEKEAISRLEQLSGYSWPGIKVKVELTAYANYAGAYTVTKPGMAIFISSLDPFSLQSEFIETVFHEGSHLLFTQESLFRSKIYFRSQEMKMEFPKNLWHAGQFYLCGQLIKDLLKPFGTNHTLSMDLKKIFINYNKPLFRQVLEKYYKGEVSLESTVDSLLKM
jgi:hypothetical protein